MERAMAPEVTVDGPGDPAPAGVDPDAEGEAEDGPSPAGTDGTAGTEDGRATSSAGLSWPRVAVLAVAVAFLGFAAGLFVSRDRPPGEDSVDVGFYQDMISHHEQGLEMATLALVNAEDATVRSFADEVHVFQSYEIGVMDITLHEWGYSRADRSETAMAWMGMPHPVAEMPGMATQAQLDELSEARGADADALFLELMADHHLGGLHMADYAAANASDHDVRALAERIAYNQAVEINEYAQTAERLGLPVEIERVPVPSEPVSH
jgi:uncharacterized protein (DUF305 family)